MSAPVVSRTRFLFPSFSRAAVQRLKGKGIECTWTESVYENIKKLDLPDLEAMVKKLYDDGFGRFVVKQIREYKQKLFHYMVCVRMFTLTHRNQ